MPMFITISIVSLCLMFNVFSLFLVLEGCGLIGEIAFFNKEYRFVGAPVFLGIVAVYYLYGRKYKIIYDSFVDKRKQAPSTFMSISVVVLYYILSFVVLLIAGMYKNKDWIFSG